MIISQSLPQMNNLELCTKNIQIAMKHMILSFKMKGDVVSDHLLTLWFQKDSLDRVGFMTFVP